MNGAAATQGGTISVSLKRVKPIAAQAQMSGVDISAELTALALPADLMRRNDHERISLADYYRIQNRFSLLFDDETCHLSARQLLPGSTDFVLRNVGDCSSLFEAMKVIAKSYNLLHGGEYNCVARKDGAIDYIIDDRDFPYAENLSPDDCYFSIESTLIFFHCMLMTIAPTAARSSVKRLYIRRPKRDGECGHLAYWRAPIRFGADRYRMVFDAETALGSIPPPPQSALTSSAVYRNIVEAVTQSQASATGAINAQVRDALARGVVEQKAVAALLGLSVATLRRRLQNEGVSFRALRRDVLNETAKRLLQNNRSISDVSESLGFAEFRSFNRAFKDWNGLTPKAYMRRCETKNIAKL